MTISGPLIASVAFVYLGLLFALAHWADRRADQGRSVIARPTVYALSLAVYCTAWTFYGSVGRAASGGLGFLTIYLGPTLAALLWGSLLVKMVRVSKAERITSIADFIASRYGKSHLLGGLVTLIAVVGVVPYIALQLKAISRSFIILLEYPAIVMPDPAATLPIWHDTAFVVALLLALFTILFGTRHLDASERHEGLVAAIAFESIVKLAAFLAVGLFVVLGLFGGAGLGTEPTQELGAAGGSAEALFEPRIGDFADWFAISLLAGLAVMFLPRQFQVAVVEISDERHIQRAIWLFPLYLFLINLFVIPIALAGVLTFGAGGVDADSFVLTLPMAHGQPWLALFVFIGGLSAATGMVIVETIALSTMVSNDLMLPVLLRRWQGLPPEADMGKLLLRIRRGAIVAILLLGYLYYRLAGDAYALVSIGLISFAAVAQFAPPIIAGLYWRGGTRGGALAGLTAGFAVWLYTLLIPSFAKSGWLPLGFLEQGPFGIELLKPQALLGLAGLNEITHALIWSLTANIGAFLIVSSRRMPNAEEMAQASAFVDALKNPRRAHLALWRGNAEVAELLALAERFLGAERARTAFVRFASSRGVARVADLPADARTVYFAETLLSGAIGGASARVMVASVTQEETLGLDEVLDILDEASQIRAYSHELERKSQELEAATAELRAANLRLQELDRLKDDFMSSVTHELRTPLASIRAFSEILHDDPDLDEAERQRFLGILVSETERLSRLVNQVLDLAKIESGHADWRAEDVDLVEVIEQAVISVGRLLEEAGLKLEMDLATGASHLVRADRDRMMQVMVNLLANAAKFSPRGSGRIVVQLEEVAAGWRVSVTDNGPGIPAAELEQVFKKFHQASAGGKKPLGTGLGLPICKQIIEHFDGRIWAECAPGGGARLAFELPFGQGGSNGAVGPLDPNHPTQVKNPV
ncbi:MAG: histidine kinase [Chromatiaceae bacterium]|nr:histidine kinase [Chromatiaceae bacterium]